MPISIDSSDFTESLLSSHINHGHVEILQSCTPQPHFTNILQNSLDDKVNRLRTRVGLVPNYFMTRGEAEAIRSSHFLSFEAIGRRALESTFKLFHQSDFREEGLYVEFEQTMKTVREAVATRRDDDCFKDAVASVLNRQTYNDGNALLHILVKRRHLRFVRTLLLHAGDLLHLDQRNRAGHSALDLAFDRLEVEIAHLLLLHGANGTADPRVVRSSSLSYGEWLFYDMVQNLDTGRWLHRQSEEAVMKHGGSHMTLRTRESLLQWTAGDACMSNETLFQLGQMPRLFAIVLADGCDAITNHEAWATVVRHLSFLRDAAGPSSQEENSNERIIDWATRGRREAIPCSHLYEFLQSKRVDTSNFCTAGRTVFFRCHDGTEMAVKLSKSLEEAKTPHPLAKEAEMNSRIGDFKCLQSEYPVTVALLRLTQVPQEIRSAIATQQASGYHPFELSADENGVTALIYRPPTQYRVYVNDPSLSLDACRSGIEKATFDSAVLARHGLYHAALVDIQHDATREQRPHLWSFESYLTRFRGGAGRIEKGFAGLAAPNVRASGLADLKHILTKDQVLSRYDPSVLHAQHNVLYNDKERDQVAEIEQVGSCLFATALLAASSWQARHVGGVPESENLDLARELRNCFMTFLRGYLNIDEKKAEQFLRLAGTDFDQMASQMKMFSTSKYVSIAETGAPCRPIFGVLAKILGWLTHPTAFVHFAQRGSLNLASPHRCLPQIKDLYNLLSTTTEYPTTEYPPHVDTSMMRCSPTWVGGKGWVDRKGQGHFGSYEGVLPFQRLIRDLYACVHLAWLVRRHGKESFQLFV